MKNVEEENGSTEVKDLEERLGQQVYRVSPNPDFRSALKDHLKASYLPAAAGNWRDLGSVSRVDFVPCAAGNRHLCLGETTRSA